MILLYVSPHEVKWVDYDNKVCIGIKADRIHGIFQRALSNEIKRSNKVILFGSCGRLDSNLRDYGELIIPGSWYINSLEGITVNAIGPRACTMDHSVKEKWERKLLFYLGFYCVDQESYHVGKLCQGLGVPFVSVRYMIDRCDRKAMPIGINHFWRRYQHRRMQLRFNKWLREEVCSI